jgi:hypothetical protein
MGILSVGALSASAAGTCCGEGNCASEQTKQKFIQETAPLFSAVQAKDVELRGLYVSDRIDTQKASVIEAELKELKGKISAVGEKYGIAACCRS